MSRHSATRDRLSDRPLPGPVDQSILAALARYHVLTARQLTRLLYAPSSLTYLQARIKYLADVGYAQRIFLPRPTRSGSAPFVYALAHAGRSIVRVGDSDADEQPTNRSSTSTSSTRRQPRPSEIRALSYLHLAHTLALNDVLIALARFCRAEPRVALVKWLHERELKRRSVAVSLPGGQTVRVMPDAWVDLCIDGCLQECYAIELDRGTMGQAAWRHKVTALAAYASGPYQRTFATRALTIAVVATPGATRRAALLRWTTAELAACGRLDLADCFRITDVAFGECSPWEAFRTPAWWIPGGQQPVPLLVLPHTSTRAAPSCAADSSDASLNSPHSPMTDTSSMSDIADNPDPSRYTNRSEEYVLWQAGTSATPTGVDLVLGKRSCQEEEGRGNE